MTPLSRLFLGWIELIEVECHPFTPLLLALIEPDVGHNFHQPGTTTLLLRQLMQRSIGAQECFLDQILGGARVASKAHGGVVKGIQVGQD